MLQGGAEFTTWSQEPGEGIVPLGGDPIHAR